MASGVSASPKSRSQASAVVSSFVRRLSTVPISMRNGSRRVCSATSVNAVSVHPEVTSSRMEITW